MSRKLTYAAAALIATLAIGATPNVASAQDLGGFLRIGDGGFAIGIDIRDHDDCFPRFHTHPRYEIRRERVWREGYWKVVEVPAVYRTIRRHGCETRILVRPARCERVFVPGCWDWVEQRVLVGEDRCFEDHGRGHRRGDWRRDDWRGGRRR